MYEPDRGWALRKDVHARNLRWTVTDTDISPDERFLIYSSITPDVHLVRCTDKVLHSVQSEMTPTSPPTSASPSTRPSCLMCTWCVL